MSNVAEPKPCAVYIAYNKAGEMLYVGITADLTGRMRGHAEKSPWWLEARKLDIEHFSSRAAARAREKLLIYAYQPPHNVQDKSTPTALRDRSVPKVTSKRSKVKLGRK